MTTQRYALALMAGLTLAAAAPADVMRGVITHVDLDKKQLDLEGRGRGARNVRVTFALSDKTQVLFADQAGALADLEAGRRVRIEFDGKDYAAEIIRVIGRRPAEASVPDVPPVPPVPTDGDGLTGLLRRVGYSDREVVLVGPGANGAETETTVEAPPTTTAAPAPTTTTSRTTAPPTRRRPRRSRTSSSPRCSRRST